MDEPLETAELLAFTKAVEAKSLSRAAAELGSPRATLSRRLARLEQRLGVRLLRRTTRSLTLTDAGQAFYAHARIALDAVQQARGSVMVESGAVRGTLRVALPAMPDAGFHAAICDFLERYPEVRAHLHFSARHVDLRRDGFDVALRAGTELEPGLIARTLLRTSVIASAAPAYLKQHGVPRSARDLKAHRCLMGFVRGEVPQTYWPKLKGGRMPLEGALFSNEINFLFEAAVRGLGIALLPRLMVEDALARGSLVHVLPKLIGADSRLALVYPDREFMPPQLRAFAEMIAAWVPEGVRPRRGR
jgi:DNA-binding transcriptional LysR family regulator